ncbi:pyridoxamine 5'-phosphate oxidase family protein [Lysinibacillus sp. 3P01SB]|uniref:pyridoxamine 5'-phosphate oxidase family protein n=1 Tax=Lysinibacillus sp. 3P01SB TaxID=3132284 RepID=UPI0039A4B0B7
MSTTKKEQALEILSKNYVGVMATVAGDRPTSRYMTFEHEDFTLYTATPRDSDLLKELQANPHTHILYGYENGDMGDTFLEIEGTAAEFNADAIKEKIVAKYPYHVDGMSMTLLKIEPVRMRFMNKAGDNQEDVDFQ